MFIYEIQTDKEIDLETVSQNIESNEPVSNTSSNTKTKKKQEKMDKEISKSYKTSKSKRTTKKNVSNDNSPKCLICESPNPLCVIIPCEHSVVCYQCGQSLHTQNKLCPSCNGIMETVWPE